MGSTRKAWAGPARPLPAARQGKPRACPGLTGRRHARDESFSKGNWELDPSVGRGPHRNTEDWMCAIRNPGEKKGANSFNATSRISESRKMDVA